ncbi:MAG: DNA polymerase III subunit gamma/tau [Clostridiales bacterium]|jgi:DNA polymerase-3 subunit gamma/tau|nr:DNA polymerase III subunit gamma/tau [Clostridiales bacterium]
MSVSLYRNFRPLKFGDVVGQDHIVRTLVNQIKTGNISHAYIFTGTRGTGKTSTAKIFARAVNCLNPADGSPCGVCAACSGGAESIDVLELDGASNNGVDEIRAIRDNSNFPPVGSRYKVYIIDEVHMLSINAFNALLKTLEEPPRHTIFILATTEIHKVPQTVLSRCMRFDFRLVPADIIAGRIEAILGELGLKYEKPAVDMLAKLGEGSVRDALSYADIALAYSDGFIKYKDVLDSLMVSPPDAYIPLAESVLSGDVKGALIEAERLLKINSNVNILRREFCELFKNLIFIKTAGEIGARGLPKELYAALKPAADRYDARLLYRAFEIFVRLEADMRYSANPAALLEAAVIRAADSLSELDETGLLIRLKNLENRLDGGGAEIKKNGNEGGGIRTRSGSEDGGAETRKNAGNGDTEARKNDAENKGKGTETRSGSENGVAEARENVENGVAGARKNGSAETRKFTAADARSVLGNTVKALRQRGYFQLFTSFNSVYEAEIEGEYLKVYFTDAADFDCFCFDANIKTAQGILSEIADLRFKPVLRTDGGANPSGEAERLKELFRGVNVIMK